MPPHAQRAISTSNTTFYNCAQRIFPDAWCGYAASSLCAAIAGSLAIGQPADTCIFDPTAFWAVTAQTLRSQGKNSPYLRREFEGRVTHTLVNGALVFHA